MHEQLSSVDELHNFPLYSRGEQCRNIHSHNHRRHSTLHYHLELWRRGNWNRSIHHPYLRQRTILHSNRKCDRLIYTSPDNDKLSDNHCQDHFRWHLPRTFGQHMVDHNRWTHRADSLHWPSYAQSAGETETHEANSEPNRCLVLSRSREPPFAQGQRYGDDTDDGSRDGVEKCDDGDCDGALVSGVCAEQDDNSVHNPEYS